MKKLFLTAVLASVIVSFSIAALGQESAPKVINGGVLNGKAVSLPKPEYPDAAKAAGIEGVVKVQVTIDENGNIESAQAIKEDSDNDELTTEKTDARAALRQAAERAALDAKFSPTLLGGEPVKVKGMIIYDFVWGEASADRSTPGGTGSLNSRAIELPDPEYPAAAKDVRASGIVRVQVTIDRSGNVIAARALSGHPLLQPSAIAAARRARFEPSNEDVKIVGVLTYNFALLEKQ